MCVWLRKGAEAEGAAGGCEDGAAEFLRLPRASPSIPRRR